MADGANGTAVPSTADPKAHTAQAKTKKKACYSPVVAPVERAQVAAWLAAGCCFLACECDGSVWGALLQSAIAGLLAPSQSLVQQSADLSESDAHCSTGERAARASARCLANMAAEHILCTPVWMHRTSRLQARSC